ncbi:putative GPI-anchored protein [Apostasia shenzhenica]|uniref:Putative GPI-anchored protein n=1 Tax=Apostasia shenzhenica TaxID=1088818 RepID=A0A2I0BBL2_9ASPA|nr:putative GPI-anchored protein [Apostasia shenzhenica]
MPCVLFAEGAAPVPSTACCSALAGMQRRHPGCLCLVVNGTVAIPVPVNRYRILLLPALCRFHVSGDFEACGGAMKPPAPHERAPEYDSHRQPTPVPQPPQPPPPPPRIISGMLFGVSSGRKLGVDMLAFGILGLLA